MTQEEIEQLREERERRALKYGIRAQDGRPLTPPADYPEDPEQYGDPVNYVYPIDEEHIQPAIAYFNREGQREAGGYSEREWRIIGERIAAAATRYLDAHYEYKDGKVVRADEKAVKVLREDDRWVILGGHAVVFGGQDLVGDTFTADTDFWLDKLPGARPVLYDHSLERFGLKTLGQARLAQVDDGLWVEAQIERSEEYRRMIEPLVRSGVLGWSTGAAGHLVRRDGNIILSWPIVEVSLTPTPAEPRTLGVTEIRSLADVTPTVKSLLEAVSPTGQPETESHKADVQSEGQEAKMDENLIAQVAAKVADETVARLTASKSVPYAVGAEDEVKSFDLWLRKGAPVKTMREGAPAEGGYLVPVEYAREIITALAEQSIIRAAGARVVTMRAQKLEVPSLAYTVAAALTAEEAAFDEREPTVNNVEFTAYKFTRLTRVSDELLADSQFDVWGQVLQPDFVQAFAAAENQYFTVGSGTGQPQGVVTGAQVGKTAASTTAITADDVIDLYHSLNYLYRQNAVWMMHDQTAAAIRKLKDANGQYLWQTGLAEGTPDRLLGRPVITNNFMPTIGANNRVILFGDFRYYWIAQREDMTIKRLDELYAANGHVGFRAYMRADGRVMLPSAFQTLRMAAS